MSCERAARQAQVLGVAMLWMAAALGGAASAPPGSAQIVVKEFMFQPTALTVKAGVTVTWSNQDQEPHTIRSDTGLFASGALDANESFSFRFEKPGTYHFICSIHPRMTGIIVVQ